MNLQKKIGIMLLFPRTDICMRRRAFDVIMSSLNQKIPEEQIMCLDCHLAGDAFKKRDKFDSLIVVAGGIAIMLLLTAEGCYEGDPHSLFLLSF